MMLCEEVFVWALVIDLIMCLGVPGKKPSAGDSIAAYILCYGGGAM